MAVQADVSLLGASACGAALSAPLFGKLTLQDALARLLDGAPCAWRVVDPVTVRILPLPIASPQARPSAPLTPVAELMITARKRPERLDALAAGVSAISGEQLRATGVGDVRETSGQLVGVLMTNLGPGRDKLMMRGLSDGAFTGRARSTVSTYLDDSPINYNAPDPDLKLTDVERVETVRGPQGALYGSGALAGIYRIVTNKPDLAALSAGASAVAGWTKGGSPSQEAEGYWSAPIVQGRAAVRLVAYYDQQGGYLDNVSLRLSNVDTTARVGGRAAVRLALSDDWQLDLSAAVQRLRSEDTQYTTPVAGKNRRANRVREAHDNDFFEAAATLTGDLDWADLHSSTTYVRHDYSSLYDATAAATLFTEVASDLGIYSERARISRFVQDVVVTSKASGPANWLVGAYGSFSAERTPDFLDTKSGNAPLVAVYREDRRDHLTELAIYGEGAWRFAPGWSVSLGGRAFRNELKVDATIVGAPPAQSRAVLERPTFKGVSSKLSVQYQLPSGGLIYGLYSEGFRPGGINSTGFLTIRPSRASFGSDRLQNFELGAKGRFFDNHLIVRAATFYDIWSNIQSDQYRPSGLAYTANVGDAHISGVEAEVGYSWDFGLTLQANGLLSSPKFTHANPDFANQLGPGLPGAPRFSGGFVARYDRPLPWRELALRVTASTSYVGSARLTFDPALSARTDAVLDTNLTGDLVSRHWSLGLFVANPVNTSGNTFAYGNPFTFGQVRQVTPQRPRTVGVRLAAAF